MASSVADPSAAARPSLAARLLRAPLSISFSSSLTIQGLNVVTGVLLAHVLGVHDRGALAAVVLWPTVIAQLGTLGVAESITFHVSRRSESTGRIVGAAAALCGVQSLVLGAIGVGVLQIVLRSYPQEARTAGLVFLLHIPLWLAAIYLMTILNGRHRFIAFHAVRVVPFAVTVAGLVGLAASGDLTIRNATFVYLAGDAVALVVAAVLVSSDGAFSGIRPAVVVERLLLRFGLRSYPGTAAVFLNELLGQLVVSVVLGPAKLGLYVIAVTLGSVTNLLGQSAAFVALPSIAALPEGAERAAAAGRLVRTTALLGLLVTAPVFILAPELIRLFFGASFVPATPAARVLLFGTVILSTNRALGGVVRAVDRPLGAGIAESAALAVNIVGMAVLLPVFGLAGAALAATVAYSVSFLLLIRAAGGGLGCRPRALLAPQSRRPPGQPRLRAAALGATAFALALSTAVAVVEHRLLYGVGLFLFLVAAAVGATRWRWSIYGLLAYIPVSGVAIIKGFQNTHEHDVAVLAKDIFFVLPAYVGFLIWFATRRPRPSLRWAPAAAIAALAVLVVGQAFNNTLPRRLVGLIGIKVWLLYIPLLALGYFFVRERRQLERVIALMALTGIVPAAIGIVEAGLFATGHAQTVYNFYGAAAGAVTQGFTRFLFTGGGELQRVSSTFSFGQQYYAFVSSMSVVSYCWWALARTRSQRWWRGGLAVFYLGAVMLSGQRGAFLLFPILVVLVFVIDHGLSRRATVAPLILGVMVGVAAIVFGIAPTVLASHLVSVGRAEFGDLVVGGFHNAVRMTWRGLGTGIDTNQTRYAFGAYQFQGVGGKVYESWWVKTYLELGVIGFLLVGWVVYRVIARPARAHRTIRDRGLRSVSAALLAFLIWNVIYALKTQYLDLDPINVYFWLFAGILTKIVVLDHAQGDAGTASTFHDLKSGGRDTS